MYDRKLLYNIYESCDTIDTKLIKKLFNKFHVIFCNKKIKNITYKYTTRLTKSAAMLKVITEDDKVRYELSVSKFIFDNLSNKVNLQCNGLLCKTKMKCLIVVLEHEYIHYKLNENHSPTFIALANSLFGHKTCTHELLENYKKSDFKLNITYNIILNKKPTKVKIIKLNNKRAHVINLLNNDLLSVPYSKILIE